jgi:hypothetical protein
MVLFIHFLCTLFRCTEYCFQGRRVALCTKNAAGSWLRIVEPRTTSNWSIPITVQLPTFENTLYPVNFEEVNHLTFSEDGVLLAVSRGDNRVLVYDSRMIGSGPLHEFWNQPRSGTPADYKRAMFREREWYGVCYAQWIHRSSGGLGLVTGGNDGTS